MQECESSMSMRLRRIGLLAFAPLGPLTRCGAAPWPASLILFQDLMVAVGQKKAGQQKIPLHPCGQGG